MSKFSALNLDSTSDTDSWLSNVQKDYFSFNVAYGRRIKNTYKITNYNIIGIYIINFEYIK